MKLLEPISIGNITLKNRMAMAPMTRSRAGQNGQRKTNHPNGSTLPVRGDTYRGEVFYKRSIFIFKTNCSASIKLLASLSVNITGEIL